MTGSTMLAHCSSDSGGFTVAGPGSEIEPGRSGTPPSESSVSIASGSGVVAARG